MVAHLLARKGLYTGSPKQRASAELSLAPEEWTLSDLALALDMPAITLFSWIRKGWVRARQIHQAGRTRWLVWADAQECERLRARRTAPRGWANRPRIDAPTFPSTSE